MRCKAPDKRFYRELTDLNTEFLGLVQAADPPAGRYVLGLDEAITTQIAALDGAQLLGVAETPTLLAGFPALPPLTAVGEERPRALVTDAGWSLSARTFAAGLLTYLWQVVQREPLNAALCVGLSMAHVNQLAGLSFREIQVCAGAASHRLEARFCRHPRFWPDLLRATRTGNGTLQRMSRLSSIPMTVAEQRPNRVSRKAARSW